MSIHVIEKPNSNTDHQLLYWSALDNRFDFADLAQILIGEEGRLADVGTLQVSARTTIPYFFSVDEARRFMDDNRKLGLFDEANVVCRVVFPDTGGLGFTQVWPEPKPDPDSVTT